MKTAQFSHKPNNTDISLMALNFYFPPCKGSPVSNVPGQGQAPMGLAERKSSSPMAAVFSFAKPCGYGHGTVRQDGTVRQAKNKKYRLPEPDVFNRKYNES